MVFFSKPNLGFVNVGSYRTIKKTTGTYTKFSDLWVKLYSELQDPESKWRIPDCLIGPKELTVLGPEAHGAVILPDQVKQGSRRPERQSIKLNFIKLN